jgi:hypothetical protein
LAGSPPDFVRPAVTLTFKQVDGVATITKIAIVTAGAARRRSANRYQRDSDTSQLSHETAGLRVEFFVAALDIEPTGEDIQAFVFVTMV